MKKFLGIVLSLLLFSGLAFSQGVQCHCPDKPDVSVTVDCTKAVVSWTHDGNYVKEFNIIRDGDNIATVGRTVRSWTDETVQEGFQYTYGVRAKGCWCNSNYDYERVDIPKCPNPPKELDCKIDELDYFYGDIFPYFDDELVRSRYYVVLKWGIEGKGARDGEWELLKVWYKIDKDTLDVIDGW